MQILRITAMNLRSIPSRLGISLVICLGTACVVAVLVTVLSMVTGLTATMIAGAEPDHVLVMRKGALAESLSSLSREAVLAVESAPGVETVDGHPALSPEVVLSVDLPRRDGLGQTAVFVRGITGQGRLIRTALEPTDGRWFEPGLFEIVVGRALQQQLGGVAIGDRVTFYANDWTVVGVFDREGAATESQVITDAATLMAAANRNIYSTVTARIGDAAAFEEFKAALESDPRLIVEVSRTVEHYSKQAESASQILEFVAYVVSGIMALGALFGSVNTMYTAVSARTAEIATLRALGFGGGAVVISVLGEALLLSLIGAALGAVVSWVLFGGINFDAGGQLAVVAVELRLGLPVVLTGVAWACAIGLLAGLFPAVRAARLPVAEGLRVSA
jgi:putative ABC transport system permease protein